MQNEERADILSTTARGDYDAAAEFLIRAMKTVGDKDSSIRSGLDAVQALLLGKRVREAYALVQPRPARQAQVLAEHGAPCCSRTPIAEECIEAVVTTAFIRRELGGVNEGKAGRSKTRSGASPT